MKALLRPLLIGTMLLVGCSTLSVNYDFDPGADFATYKTYRWLRTSDQRTGVKKNSLIDKRIKTAAEFHLAQAGLRLVTDDPDLLVIYHIGTSDKIQVTSYGYGYGSYWGGYGGSGVDVYQYKEGTLILDLVDARSEELVWRGTATDVMDTNPSPEQVDEKLDQVFFQMLANYPPSRQP